MHQFPADVVTFCTALCRLSGGTPAAPCETLSMRVHQFPADVITFCAQLSHLLVVVLCTHVRIVDLGLVPDFSLMSISR